MDILGVPIVAFPFLLTLVLYITFVSITKPYIRASRLRFDTLFLNGLFNDAFSFKAM
jgi:hypothetical protein